MAAPTQYQPLVLQLTSLPGLDKPGLLVLVLLIVLLPLHSIADISMLTLLTLVSNCGTVSYLRSRQQRHLLDLRAILQVNNDEFTTLQRALEYFPRRTLRIVSCLAPILFISANWGNPRLHELLSGTTFDAKIIASLIAATLAWILFAQTIAIVVINSRRFMQLGREQAEVDLLNTGRLAPFMRVGLSTFLVFVMGYTLTPIGVLQRPDALGVALVGMLLSLPVGLAALLAPALAVRNRIRREKTRELLLVNRALRGDKDCLKSSLLADEIDTISISNMLIYRDWLEKLSDWPVDDVVTRKLLTYVIVPIFSWGAAFALEQWLQSAL